MHLPSTSTLSISPSVWARPPHAFSTSRTHLFNCKTGKGKKLLCNHGASQHVHAQVVQTTHPSTDLYLFLFRKSDKPRNESLMWAWRYKWFGTNKKKEIPVTIWSTWGSNRIKSIKVQRCSDFFKIRIAVRKYSGITKQKKELILTRHAQTWNSSWKQTISLWISL